MTFRNSALSVSRLKKWEQCPLAFKFRYIDQLPSEPSGEPAEFGTFIHSVLEQVYSWAQYQEHSGPVPSDLVLDIYRRQFEAAPPILNSLTLYHDGLGMTRRYFERHPTIDHWSVLAVEREFAIQVGRFKFIGFMDRVDRISDDEIHVIDYKTSRLLYTRDDLASDIQASAYLVAAKEIFPWAKKIWFGFDMLRFDLRQYAERTPQELEEALDYMEILGAQTESYTEHLPKLNANCSYCDYRMNCPAYADALSKRKLEFARPDPNDLDAVAEQRELMHAISRAAYTRKSALDDVLKAHIEQVGPFVAGGRSYRITPQFSKQYPAERTVQILSLATGRPAEEIRGRIMAIDSEALEEFIRSLDPQPEGSSRHMKSPRTRLLEAELDAIALKEPKTGRFDSSPVKGAAAVLPSSPRALPAQTRKVLISE